MVAADETPEFSYVIHPSEHGEKEKIYELEADSGECEALALRFDLLGIEYFRPRLGFQRLRGDATYRLRGRIRARVTQQCVVTLEPVVSDIDAPFEVFFHMDFQGDRFEMAVEREIEPLDGDLLDLGEIAAEELVMALDPYPRRHDIAPSEFTLETDPGLRPTHPFAALAAIKGKK